MDKMELYNFILKKGWGFTEKYFEHNFVDLYNEYVKWTFPENFAFKQKLYHFLFNDTKLKIGLCPICGNRTTFPKFRIGYYTYCSNQCKGKDKSIVQKIKNTKEKLYGDANYNNRELAKKTNLKKYGFEYSTQSDITKEKSRKTKFEKYGDPNYNNVKKYKETWNKKSVEELELIKRKHKNSALLKSDKEKEEICKKISKSKQFNNIKRKDFIVGYTDDGNWICKCPHEDCNLCKEKTFEIFQKNYNARVNFGVELCTKLKPIGHHISQLENEIKDFVTSIYDGIVEYNNRSLLNKKELDIYIPEKRFAIEFNGLYWHSDVYKSKNYHYKKCFECASNGVFLLNVWEDEWVLQKENTKDIIRRYLNLCEIKIDGSLCQVECVDKKTVEVFAKKKKLNTLLNFNDAICLKYKEEIVAIGLFNKINELTWELSTFLYKTNVSVFNGETKIIRYFIENHKQVSINIYVPVGYNIDGFLKDVGFTKTDTIRKNCYLIKENKRFLINDINCSLYNENNKQYKLWDSGYILYVYNGTK